MQGLLALEGRCIFSAIRTQSGYLQAPSVMLIMLTLVVNGNEERNLIVKSAES